VRLGDDRVELEFCDLGQVVGGAIASCIAGTASKSSGPASRILAVVPSARSAYTRPVSCAVLIGVSLT
jgi:hypothetical protein